MVRLIALSLVLTLPGASFASAHLLDRQLALSLGQTGDSALPPPTPPPPPPAFDGPEAEEAAPAATLNLTVVEPPTSGMGFLITGGIFGGIGLTHLIASIVSFIPNASGFVSATSSSDGVLNLVLAMVAFSIGVPVFIVGLNRRAAYDEFVGKHPQITWLLPGTEGRIAVATF
jgi:hypothetical protein